MARIRANNTSGGGGGGITAYTKEGNSTSGTSPTPQTADSSVIYVETGLSTVTRFRFMAKVLSANEAWVLVDYDSTRTVGKCMTVGLLNGSANGAIAGESFPMNGTTYGTVIRDIDANGKITLLTGSRTTWGRFSYSEWQAG